MSEHTCHFEKLPLKVQPSLWGPEVYAFERLLQRLSLLFKGQKMAGRSAAAAPVDSTKSYVLIATILSSRTFLQ